jgi:hypothetical protein
MSPTRDAPALQDLKTMVVVCPEASSSSFKLDEQESDLTSLEGSDHDQPLSSTQSPKGKKSVKV